MEQLRIAVVFHSTHGHTRKLAEAVLAGVKQQPGVTPLFLTASEASTQLGALDLCDAIIFGSPAYMGNIAAEFKSFMEASVSRWFTRAWSDKIAGAFCNSSNFYGDKGNVINGLWTFAMQHGMIYVGLNDLADAQNESHSGMRSIRGPGPDALNRIGASTGPMSASFELKPEDAPASGDLLTAEHYGKRIAEITTRFCRN